MMGNSGHNLIGRPPNQDAELQHRTVAPFCPAGCAHTDAEHLAFDLGWCAGLRQWSVDTVPYANNPQREAWLIGHSLTLADADTTARTMKSGECSGHGRGGVARCCDRAGEYNGYGSDGPTIFTCARGCSCHD